MCLILFAVDVHPRHHLVLASNRDEFHDRPSAPATWWAEAPHVLAGRDLRAGGTWMGVSRGPAGMRWTAVTNVRDLRNIRDDARSRGELTRDFLLGQESAAAAADRAHAQRSQFNPFNLLTGDEAGVWYASSHEPAPVALGPGLYGLSNATLNTPWPKVTGGLRELGQSLEADPIREDDLLDLLDDRAVAPDDELPDTGVGRPWERVLSARFIVGENYGSRASTLLLLNGPGGRLVERSYGPWGVAQNTVAFDL